MPASIFNKLWLFRFVEFPKRYFDEVLDYLQIQKSEFEKICNSFRSPHIWKKTKKGFKLRHTVNGDGVDD